jgi:hypothetical protein
MRCSTPAELGLEPASCISITPTTSVPWYIDESLCSSLALHCAKHHTRIELPRKAHDRGSRSRCARVCEPYPAFRVENAALRSELKRIGRWSAQVSSPPRIFRRELTVSYDRMNTCDPVTLWCALDVACCQSQFVACISRPDGRAALLSPAHAQHCGLLTREYEEDTAPHRWTAVGAAPGGRERSRVCCTSACTAPFR